MILVADRNRTTAELLVRRLRADGFQADSASSTDSVLSRVRAGGVSALVMDPTLPGHAYEMLGRVRVCSARMPVIVFATSDRPEDVQEATDAGATAFLVKGRVSPTQLVDRIRALLSTGTTPSSVEVRGPGEATSSEAGGYYVWVRPDGDSARLALDLGVRPGMRCAHCQGALSLYLQRDFSRWGQWLFGTFGCLVCAKRRMQPGNEPIVKGTISVGGVS